MRSAMNGSRSTKEKPALPDSFQLDASRNDATRRAPAIPMQVDTPAKRILFPVWPSVTFLCPTLALMRAERSEGSPAGGGAGELLRKSRHPLVMRIDATNRMRVDTHTRSLAAGDSGNGQFSC